MPEEKKTLTIHVPIKATEANAEQVATQIGKYLEANKQRIDFQFINGQQGIQVVEDWPRPYNDKIDWSECAEAANDQVIDDYVE